MGYQFLHVECYARATPKKGKSGGHNIDSILAEARRDSGACPHVEHPAPAILLHGVPLDEVEDIAHEWAIQSVDGRGHKLRKDGLCLLAGVVSVPDDFQDWEHYKRHVIAWLIQEFGERLRSVIEHTDEAHRHLHFYAVALPGERFEVLHPGRQASADAKARGEVKGQQNTAYCTAMRAWQKGFHQVSKRFGLLPRGPGKRRLTREQWRAEQEQAKAVEMARQRAKRIQEKAQADADRLIEEAQASAVMITGWGNRLGQWLSGIRETFTGTTAKLQAQLATLADKVEFHKGQAKRIRREREAVKQELEEEKKAARLQLEAEQQRRRKAEAGAEALAYELEQERTPDTPSLTIGKGWQRKS